MSAASGNFVDRIDPFAKRSLKKKPKRSQGSSRYRTTNDVELQPLPLLKGKVFYKKPNFKLYFLLIMSLNEYFNVFLHGIA